MRGRIVAMALVLSGASLGWLLPRPWAEPAQAQGPGPVDIRCVGFEPRDGRKALAVIHNPGPVEITAEFTWIRNNGRVLETFQSLIGPGASSETERTDENIGAVLKVTAPVERLAVDAQMIYDDDADEVQRRPVTCTRVSP